MGPIKAAGKYRQEGRGYEVKDGEFVLFSFLILFEALISRDVWSISQNSYLS